METKKEFMNKERELLYQATGCLFTVAIRLKKEATSHILEAPLSNEIYHCLRRLRVNEKTGELEIVRHHAIEQWPEQAVFADGDTAGEALIEAREAWATSCTGWKKTVLKS